MAAGKMPAHDVMLHGNVMECAHQSTCVYAPYVLYMFVCGMCFRKCLQLGVCIKVHPL